MTNRIIERIFIVSGGFLCFMIADGCTFSIGILYTKFLYVFLQSTATTAVLPGLIYAIPQISGPIVCPLIDIIGSGYGSFIGGIILSCTFLVSSFVVNLPVMYVTLGFFASIGLEMTYVSGIMAVTKGFANQKYLGLALGITVSGSGLGVFIFNPLLQYLISVYHWRGSMMIESAIFLNIIVTSCLFRLSTKMYSRSLKNSTDLRKNIPTIQIVLIPDQNNAHLFKRRNSMSHSAEAIDTVNKYYTDEDNIIKSTIQRSTIYDSTKTSVFLSKTHSKYAEALYKPISAHNRASSLDRRINRADNSQVQLPLDEHAAAFVRRLSLYSSQNIKGSLLSISGSRELSSQPNLTNVHTKNAISMPDNDHSSDHDNRQISLSNPKSSSKFKIFFLDLKRSLLALLSIKLWTNKNILLFYLSTLLFSLSVVVVWTFSFNHTIQMDINEYNAALLISLVGGGASLGQIFFGYISDFIPAISLYMLGCIISGALTIILRYSLPYVWLVVLHFMFGFSQGVNYALFSIILVHFSSMELFPANLAIYLVFSGSGNLIGTALGGYIKDLTGNYGVAYSLGGIMLMSSGIVVCPLIVNWHKFKKVS